MSAFPDLTEAETIFNRASLALAKSQRLVASWLPAKTTNEAAASKTEEELEKEDSDAFSSLPETTGLGAPITQDVQRHSTLLGHHSPCPEAKLRSQLLGRRVLSKRRGETSESNPRSKASLPPKHKLRNINGDSASEDELGRTAFSGKNNGMNKRPIRNRLDEMLPASSAQAPSGTTPSEAAQIGPPVAASKKRSSSYLDEVLLARSEKRKKREKARSQRRFESHTD